MEREYKWEAPDVDRIEEKLIEASGVEPEERDTITMEAIYYDTKKSTLALLGGALRLRLENGKGVCCLKISVADQGGGKVRQEYQVPAEDILEGLEKLPEAGASGELCAVLLSEGVDEVCRTSFTRRAMVVKVPGEGEIFTGELAVDTGRLIKGQVTAPFREIELEYKSGSLEVYHAFAAKLQESLGLQVQEKSKSQRAMEL